MLIIGRSSKTITNDVKYSCTQWSDKFLLQHLKIDRAVFEWKCFTLIIQTSIYCRGFVPDVSPAKVLLSPLQYLPQYDGATDK